ncbi:MAG TPA: hypothetical protein VF121_19240 [Thermoanaerobaculia bacterium]|nr:hypothetical protein [Thermoanaerobaculia bacterium]
MPRKSAERGDGNLGCIVWLLVLAVALMIGWEAIPVKIRTAELYDHMVELSKFSASATPEELEHRILERARELELPLDKEGVHVERIGDRIKMEAHYTVPLEYPGYSYQWKFDHVVDRPIFIF